MERSSIFAPLETVFSIFECIIDSKSARSLARCLSLPLAGSNTVDDDNDGSLMAGRQHTNMAYECCVSEICSQIDHLCAHVRCKHAQSGDGWSEHETKNQKF